jgi:membrane protein DedA with SNARE-associated domain
VDEAAVDERPFWRRVRWSRLALGFAGAVVLLALAAYFLHGLAGDDGFSLVDEASGGWAYFAVFALVFGDAICALLPGETTLNAASTLAANGQLDLGLVMLAGALGAVVGDTTLYWIARTFSGRLEPQFEKAKQNDKVATALEFLGSSAPLLLVAGRYVPGVRFAVNVMMGLTRYPYRSFLLWSAIGGTVWSIYTCGLAYLVATALSGFPLASIVISGLITTAALGVIFVVLRRRRRSQQALAEG